MCNCKKRIETLEREVDELKNEMALMRLALANAAVPEVTTKTASSAVELRFIPNESLPPVGALEAGLARQASISDRSRGGPLPKGTVGIV